MWAAIDRGERQLTKDGNQEEEGPVNRHKCLQDPGYAVLSLRKGGEWRPAWRRQEGVRHKKREGWRKKDEMITYTYACMETKSRESYHPASASLVSRQKDHLWKRVMWWIKRRRMVKLWTSHWEEQKDWPRTKAWGSEVLAQLMLTTTWWCDHDTRDETLLFLPIS